MGEELSVLRFLKNCQGQEEQIGHERFPEAEMKSMIYLTIGGRFGQKIRNFPNE